MTADSAAFSSLLQRLQEDDPAPELAYERLRFRLITYLRLRVPIEADAEALADTALDRLGRRIHDGTVVESVPQYALGIARLLVKEAEARLAVERKRSASFAYERAAAASKTVAAGEDRTHETAMQALSSCLDGLSREARDLVLSYYGGHGGAARIAARHALAQHLGVAPNALRNRALRVRMRLEKCVTAQLASSVEAGVTNPAGTSLSVATRKERA